MKKLLTLTLFVLAGLGGCSSNVDGFETVMKQTKIQLENKSWEKRVDGAKAAMHEKDVINYFKVNDEIKNKAERLDNNVSSIKSSYAQLVDLDDMEYNDGNVLLARNAAKIINNSKSDIISLVNTIDSESKFVKTFNSKYLPEMVKITKTKTSGLSAEIDKFYIVMTEALSKHKDRTKDIKEIGKAVVVAEDEIRGFKTLVDSVDGKDNIKPETMKTLYDQYTKSKDIDYVKYVNNLNKRLKELDGTYIKILKAKKANYFVQINGVTWDGYSDFDTTRRVSFPETSISEHVYKQVKNGFTVKCYSRRSCENNKSLRTLTANRSANISWRGNDEGEFWVEDVYGDFYQKFDVIKDGKVTSTGWVEVSEKEYFDYYNSVGKAVYSKPYGKFDDEANNVSKPVGASMVGNEKYGHWQTNSSGSNVWVWFAAWSMMNNYHSTPYYYNNYDRYDSYRRPHNPYYNSRYSSTRTGGSRAGSSVYSGKYSYSSVATSRARSSNTRSSYSKSTVRNNSRSNMGRGSSGGGK